MPWYKQTAVWGLIISCSALFLSQLPPIASWKATNVVTAELGKRIGLPNTLGLPGYQIFIELRNRGNRTADLSNLRLRLTYPDNDTRTLTAQTYQKIIPGQPAPLEFPITTINLAPSATWIESVSFHPDLSPEVDEFISTARQEVGASIFSKQHEVMRRGDPLAPVEADPTIIQRIHAFFDSKFDLEKGVYKGAVVADINGRETVLSAFSFTLYDYHKKTILSQKDDFKFGWGLLPIYPTVPQKQAWAQITSLDD